MNEGGGVEGQNVSPFAGMSGRRVDFGIPGEGDGLSWGIEVDIDISDSLVRARLEDNSFKIPSHIKKITYLDLAPQEALSPDERTIRSTLKPKDSIRGGSALVSVATPAKPGNPTLEMIRHGFNLLRPEDAARVKSLGSMITWVFGPSDENKKRFNKILEQSVGNNLVIVHGHSGDLSGMSEQYSTDHTTDESGNIIQKAGNFVPMESILSRYDNPSKFAAIVLNGCNTEKGKVEAKKVPVFYPTSAVKTVASPGFPWSSSGSVALPKQSITV